jgi:hypothetical protein
LPTDFEVPAQVGILLAEFHGLVGVFVVPLGALGLDVGVAHVGMRAGATNLPLPLRGHDGDGGFDRPATVAWP